MLNCYVSHNGEACGIMMGTNPNIFHPLNIDEKYFRFMPGPELNFYHYRGQNHFFELSYPSIYRLSDDEKSQAINEKREFIQLLKTHPIIKELEELKIQDSSYCTDYEGLAQHYGFATNHMDITNDKNIAMFFACTEYIDGKYFPFKESKEVVLYTINTLYPDATERLNIIGAHAIPRPAEQKAFSIELNENENFNDLEFVQYEKFICTKELSWKYFNLFDGGKKLFPDDIVDKKAKQIQNRKMTKKRDSYFTKRELSSIRKDWIKKRDEFYKMIVGPRLCYQV